MEAVRAVINSPHFWAIVVITIAVILMILALIYLIVVKAGRNLRIYGIEITRSNTLQADSQKEDHIEDPADDQIHKVVYAKVLNFRRKGIDPPLYTRVFENKDVDVYDETLVLAFHRFAEQRSSFSWRVTTAGVGSSQVFFPWMDRLLYPDPKDPQHGSFLSPTCHLESDVYIFMTHLFNDINDDQLCDTRLRAESNIRSARVILDLSSVPELKVKSMKAYRGEQFLGVAEPRTRVFTCHAEQLKNTEILRICYEFDR